jgi:hypothetical protein
LGEAPPEHVPGRPPRRVPARPIPKGDPFSQTPPEHVSHAPRQRAVGARPNPRTPTPVKDVRGGYLKDLFEMFPDLPRPARPTPRLRGRSVRRRRR